ncbi:uncharacterized protein AB675_5660 [Cyphellophora attinorum]|uniref:Uncharacterized protein n=1 Tax=Cyphellophora attinorum TaxID=1664694 RepID=A0A0N1HT45_9EURO|nr:uncharacterized protein AB675_5660 [Phialophora attinorum]KPI42043.1 hypothetical protein AB675_5660 [Phialophora attinorum]
MKFTLTTATLLLSASLSQATVEADSSLNTTSLRARYMMKWDSWQGNAPYSFCDQCPEPARDGAKGPVSCNTNSHTCDGKALTNDICAQQCSCDLPSGFITCKAWSGCRDRTVEWNCQCHSVAVPTEGKCIGFMSWDQGLQAQKTGKWPSIPPNKIKAHPIPQDVSAFKKRAFGRWGGFGLF